MFTSNHLIWRLSYEYGELNDWLPFAEELVTTWASQGPDQVRFRNTFEIQLAALMLADGLLPPSAQTALAMTLLETAAEAIEKKLSIENLHIFPPPRGRKRDSGRFFRIRDVKKLLGEGVPKGQAYEQIADRYHRSPDTIRREFERYQRKREK